jgi:hypothetical protein
MLPARNDRSSDQGSKAIEDVVGPENVNRVTSLAGHPIRRGSQFSILNSEFLTTNYCCLPLAGALGATLGFTLPAFEFDRAWK